MSKINDGNISGQSELLRSTIARLIDYIRGYKLKNRAEIADRLAILQAELGSADKTAEPDRLVADVDLDAVWRDVACQIAEQKRELNEINNSVTWRTASKLHRIIDRILPLGSKRRFLAKRVLINLAHPARLIKNLNPYKLINYYIY